jgi:predicted AlkP superfamily phosphohydrolase/phosphomutase
MRSIDKVAIIGLDCGDPILVFDHWLADLPNLQRLTRAGLWGRFESCIPPITVPAWTCMASGKDPGTLGIYGFRNRSDWSYENLALATNVDVRQPRLWDHFARAGMESIIVGVPQTFPIVRPPRGAQVTCFLTPSTRSPFTHPPELKEELAARFGDYIIDAEGFKPDQKHALLDQIYRMAQQRFQISRHLLRTRPWNLFWMVEMGVDRLQHAFWHFCDSRHRLFRADSPFRNVIRDYYILIDRLIGELLADLDLETTAVWVVSDHGAQRLEGGFCLNDWLIREGYLTLKSPLTARRRFDLGDVDWSRTRAWGDGGYTGQIFLNRAGREPQGIVPPHAVEPLRNELISRLTAVLDPTGNPMGNRLYRPEDIYAESRGCPPDLLLILGDLRWRSIGAVGHPDLFVFEADAGPDAANHASHGLYILSHPSIASRRLDASLYDLVPTSLQLLAQPLPRGLRGRNLLETRTG